MVIPKESITSYIPHRYPFVMVDNLISVSNEQFESDFFISENNILVTDQIFQEAGLIENIAQTCAASFGYLNRAEGGEAKIGYIGAISRLELFSLPPVNSKILTVVKQTHQLGTVFLVVGKNYLNDHLLMQCEMKIVLTES